MRIAIIGSGISGMVAAHLLSPENEVTVFEANDYIGGHTHTIDVAEADRIYNPLPGGAE
jgi:predicted NAD/FAD-binding protein